MPDPIRFFFDYVDPASYLLDTVLTRRELREERDLVRVPLEIRPPPSPLPDPEGEPWRTLHGEMEALAEELDVPLARPSFIPWTRKAHELAFHAREKGCFPPVHRALFEAHFVEGKDIGRVDVLVEIASSQGLDRTEVKTVLDVDRFTEALRERRKEAEDHGAVGVPTLLAGEHRLEGFAEPEALDAFLARLPGADPS